MTWPIYPTATSHPVLRAHAKAQEGTTPSGPDTWCAAVDVWRSGALLWRSYDPMEEGETVYSWADRELPPGVAENHANGYWRLPGMDAADWPVPAETALRPVGGPTALRDLIVTLVEMARWPAAPERVSPVATMEALIMRHYRADRDYAVYTGAAEPGVVVRVMYAKRDIAPLPGTVRRWRATLQRRTVRAGAGQCELMEGTVTFEMDAGADESRLIRAAKMSLGVTGWPAQRVAGTLCWHLTRAPYQITLGSTDSEN
jgi:hypothetical protein